METISQNYESPKMETIELETENVILASPYLSPDNANDGGYFDRD
jgi:hypothetical protein